MRVCITGATGFLGGALVRRLLAEGVFVRAFAPPSSRADELEARGVEVVRGDLTDAEAIKRAVTGMDLVYHLAARLEARAGRAEFMKTNVEGTERVLMACRQQSVGRVIYLSSLAVYGIVERGQRIQEETRYDPKAEGRDFYSHSKILADQLAVSFARSTGLALVILRPGIIYGPGRPLPIGLLGFSTGKMNFIFGQRDSHIPLNYVENLVDAMRVAAQLQGVGPKQFNILDDDALTLGQYHDLRKQVEQTRAIFLPGWPILAAAPFADAFMRALPSGGSTRLSPHQVKRALQDRWYDTRRIREETGWAPKVALREALQISVRAGI